MSKRKKLKCFHRSEVSDPPEPAGEEYCLSSSLSSNGSLKLCLASSFSNFAIAKSCGNSSISDDSYKHHSYSDDDKNSEKTSLNDEDDARKLTEKIFSDDEHKWMLMKLYEKSPVNRCDNELCKWQMSNFRSSEEWERWYARSLHEKYTFRDLIMELETLYPSYKASLLKKELLKRHKRTDELIDILKKENEQPRDLVERSEDRIRVLHKKRETSSLSPTKSVGIDSSS